MRTVVANQPVITPKALWRRAANIVLLVYGQRPIHKSVAAMCIRRDLDIVKARPSAMLERAVHGA
jgi:hypothetical protein